MSSRSFLLRLFVPFTLLMLLVVAGGGLTIYLSGRRTAQQQQFDQLDRLARSLAPLAASPRDPATRARLDEAAALTGITLVVLDREGMVLHAAGATPRAANGVGTATAPSSESSSLPRLTDPDIVEARRFGRGRDRREIAGQAALLLAVAADPHDPRGPLLRLSLPELPWPRLAGSTWIVLISGSLLAALLMSWLAFLLHRRWIGPVRRIADAASRMAGGDWSTRADLLGAVELRHLAERLNQVAFQAQKQMNDLQHQRGDLQALVDALPDPILLTDPADRIRVINLPAASLLQVTPRQVLGQKLVTAVNDAVILQLYEEVAEKHRGDSGHLPVVAHSREIRVARHGQRSTYQALATRTQQGGVLLVLRDISTLAGAVQMKTDFVANASHELRTPIAAIKVGIETLREVFHDDDPQQAGRCLAIVEGHLQRLEEMLRDLLDLSRVESADLKPTYADVSAGELLQAHRTLWLHAAAEKGVDLRFETPSPQLVFRSDRRLLDMILKNLVENSIKFTPAGGRVTVSLQQQETEDDRRIVLTVADTGIGIPAEHLDRVFERFYQVDAARSGSAGRGTGLGLAIIKHAAHALGGGVRLESEVGRGTTATVVFPHVGADAIAATSVLGDDTANPPGGR